MSEERNNYWDKETSADILMTVEYRKSLIRNRIDYAKKHFHFKKGDEIECLNIFKPNENDGVMTQKKPRQEDIASVNFSEQGNKNSSILFADTNDKEEEEEEEEVEEYEEEDDDDEEEEDVAVDSSTTPITITTGGKIISHNVTGSCTFTEVEGKHTI